MTDLLTRVVLPVASVEDAAASCRALAPYDPNRVVAVHVIEKAGGAPDKASVEQRQAEAEKIFAAVEEALSGTAASAAGRVETDLRYGTDVAETVFDAAADHDASAIVFTPRGGSRWVQLLTGDVTLDLVTGTDRPAVVLPDVPGADEGTGTPDADGEDDS